MPENTNDSDAIRVLAPASTLAQTGTAGTADGAFVELVQQALDHLYDFPYLQHHLLTRYTEQLDGPPGMTAGQRLRKELIGAIETLSPEPGVSFRATAARPYSMLQLRYIEGFTVLEAAHRLNVSARQAHRELRHGEESVAEVLWARLAAAGGETGGFEHSSVQKEIERLGARVDATDVRSLLANALRAVDKLARQRDVIFLPQPESDAVMISTDPIVAQQILVSLLSHIAKYAQPGDVSLSLDFVAPEASPQNDTRDASRDVVRMAVAYRTPAGMAVELDSVVAQLAARLGWSITHQAGEADAVESGAATIGASPRDRSATSMARRLFLRMPSSCHTVLVIDDNEGLVALLERFLAPYACQIVKAASGTEGMQLARDLKPDAIILDIMLPKVDGWEVLQTLRGDPDTSDIPVIVCSVINDPELARSLGASSLVAKPVSRDALLGVLQRAGAL